MNRTEIEKMMDQYKRELLEFSRRNSLETAYDNREQQQQAALSGTPYERDRNDPLPAGCCDDAAQEAAPEEAPQEEETLGEAMPAAVTEIGLGGETLDLSSGTADIPALLRGICSEIEENPNASETDRQKCAELYRFLDFNTERGTLRVEAFSSDRAYAVPNARVMLFLPLEDGNITLFDGLTNINGSTVSILLPAPPRALSMQPENGPLLPYATYTIYVDHPQFVRAVFTNVPVFSGIEAIQPVQMLAKSDDLNETDPVLTNQPRENSL